ncbi:MAG: PIN domain-containing protein [Candidatus Sumerlaeia bacterium]|nr:PIN domain-containing protein [Candidatus Sumerlaeia bacterium]
MSATVNRIPDGAVVLLDSNIFVYAFARKSRQCHLLIERCRDQSVLGLVSTYTLCEVCYKTMGIEAGGASAAEPIPMRSLKRRPESIKKLVRYAVFLEDIILRSNLGIIVATETDVLKSQRIRSCFGMLATDSINAQILLEYGIPAIATSDSDFERIPGITVYAPGDIP